MLLAVEQEKRKLRGFLGGNSYMKNHGILEKNIEVYSAPYLEQGGAWMRKEGEAGV